VSFLRIKETIGYEPKMGLDEIFLAGVVEDIREDLTL